MLNWLKNLFKKKRVIDANEELNTYTLSICMDGKLMCETEKYIAQITGVYELNDYKKSLLNFPIDVTVVDLTYKSNTKKQKD